VLTAQLHGVSGHIEHGRGHAVLGQSSSLIRADHGHRAQGLYCGQLADEGSAPEHPLGTQGESDGHNRRQPFGHRRDGQAYGGKEHDLKVFPAEQAQSEDHADEGHSREDKHLAYVVQASLQGGLILAGRLDQGRDLAQLRPHAGLGDDVQTSSLGDDRARVDYAGSLPQRQVDLLHGRRGLLHRLRLPGERRFLDPQVSPLQEPPVGRHQIPRLQQHHVPRHQFSGRDLPHVAFPANLHRGRG
jgi:hypothetical protein